MNENNILIGTRSEASIKRRTCGLIITHQCNLNCRYCYVEHKTDVSMSFETATELIDNFFGTNPSDGTEVVVTFMGGEPLLRFDLIRQVAEWMLEKEWSAPYFWASTTNGTLLTDESKDWFKKHSSRFALALSYDGTKTSQDMNRSLSSSRVDLDFFLQCYDKPEIKTTISEESVPEIAQGVIELTQRGFIVNANVAHGMPPWKKETFSAFERQLEILVDFYLQNPNMPVSPLIKAPIDTLSFDATGVPPRRCGVGADDYIVYDCDKIAYPCHMFSPLVQPKEKIERLPLLALDSNTTYQNPACGRCVLQAICPTCYGLNFKRTGNPALKEAYYCRIFRLQVAAACRYYSALIEEKEKRNVLTRNEQRLKDVVLTIFPLLDKEERER